MAGIKLTNLNYNLDGPQDKAVKGGKSAAGFFTGPTRSAQNFVKPNPGVTEFIKNKDPNSLAEVITTVMQKDYNSLKSIGFEGRKNVLKKFDVEKMCNSTFSEYKKLLKYN